MSEPKDKTVSFSFWQTASRSFVLNGKRYTVKHKTLPAGTYRLVPETTNDRA